MNTQQPHADHGVTSFFRGVLASRRYTVPTYESTTLAALQGKTLYGGTVDPVEVARRRAKNRVARASRRANRRASR